jgi:regulatory protein
VADPDTPHHPSTSDGQATFRSAEEFLAALGVQRDPIRVVAPTPDADGDGRPPVGLREAARLATETPSAAAEDGQPGSAPTDASAPDRTADLGDQIARAVAYARRSTAQAPKSEAKLRDKLAARDYPRVVIDRAIVRCRAERIVDDAAFAAAFADERRRKGHAPFRIQQDLRKRGFDEALVRRVLGPMEDQDRQAQAFDAARGKARTLRSVDAEAAFRRLVGYLARRGYPEGLARKVAREVIYADRERERIAGR